jgi:serine/threonine protein kinase
MRRIINSFTRHTNESCMSTLAPDTISSTTIVCTSKEEQSPAAFNRSLLDCYHLDFIEDDFFFHIGPDSGSGRWIIHLSVIRIQYTELLTAILPLLSTSHCRFQIARNDACVKHLLDGNAGVMQIGKLVSIHTHSDEQALTMTRELVRLTQTFKGPPVPSARPLGGAVYVSCEWGPATPPGNPAGFALPADRRWPFDELTTSAPAARKGLLHNKYRPLQVIKYDPKGSVVKANYFKGFLNIQYCVIKEGVRNMWSDEQGRDMIDRIKWQNELYRDLSDAVPLPSLIEMYEEERNIYLVMEFIRGTSLTEEIVALLNGINWPNLSMSKRDRVMHYLLTIIETLEILHARGYVHRDLTAANFLLSKTKQIYLIDMELAYSIKKKTPSPAFSLGTPGYMSPQQSNEETPSFNDDIYSLGALMLFAFTGLMPAKITDQAPATLANGLDHLIQTPALSALIMGCLQANPDHRPSLAFVKTVLADYRASIKTTPCNDTHVPCRINADRDRIDSAINAYLRSLGAYAASFPNKLWNSIDTQDYLPGVHSVARIPRIGLHSGMTGILYLIARAKRLGYTIDPCLPAYFESWKFIRASCLNNPAAITPGLYDGLAGIALSLNEGNNSSLLTGTFCSDYLINCFQTNADTFTLSAGLAGQGLSLLQCRNNLPTSHFDPKLSEYIRILLQSQQGNGAWNISASTRRRRNKHLDLSCGTSGILYFLLVCCPKQGSAPILRSVEKSLNWLSREARRQLSKTPPRWFSIDFGLPGLALTFLKHIRLPVGHYGKQWQKTC